MISKEKRVCGVDGWVSSPYHEHSERATTADELREIYMHWANSYDDEMLANDLQSYKSVTQVSLEMLSAMDAPMIGRPLRVMDAGCGTGLLGRYFSKSLRASELRSCQVYLAGIDLSPDMLDVAKEKGCFDELYEGNLQEIDSVVTESNFDLIISSGVFLAGHCGPETLKPLLSCLRPGGYMVFTVRSSLFQEQKTDFLAAVTDAGCELLQTTTMPYYGEIEARVLTVKKPLHESEDEAQAVWKQHYETQGFALSTLKANPAELADFDTYLTSRVHEGHPGNIFDGEGHLRAVHGYEQGLISTLMARLANQAKTLLGCRSVYLYQFRVNSKHPSLQGRGGWKPHRDYDYWQRMDGLPLPRLVVFHIFLTEQTPDNGAIVLCNGSHQADVDLCVMDDTDWRKGFEETLSYTIPHETYEDWPNKTPMLGPAGTIVAMHPLTWHASSPNQSTADRVIASIVFNDLDNLPKPDEAMDERPDFIVHRPDQYIW